MWANSIFHWCCVFYSGCYGERHIPRAEAGCSKHRETNCTQHVVLKRHWGIASSAVLTQTTDSKLAVGRLVGHFLSFFENGLGEVKKSLTWISWFYLQPFWHFFIWIATLYNFVQRCRSYSPVTKLINNLTVKWSRNKRAYSQTSSKLRDHPKCENSVSWLFTGGGCLRGLNHSGSLTRGVTYTATFWKRIHCTQFYN